MIHKRTLAVLAVAAAAGAVFPFGLPKGAAAAPLVVSYDTIVISPLPIEQPGSLNPANPSTNTVTLCVQPRDGSTPVAGTVYLSIDSGLFTSPSAAGGSAVVGATALTSTPTAFTTQATGCAFQNAETSGTAADAVQVTYTGPNPVPVNGRDVIVAASDPSDVTSGQCNGSGVCNTGTYVFSPVMSYAFSQGTGNPIAPTGSLAAGATVDFTVTALDVQSNPVPGAYIVLSFGSTPNGSATAFSAISSSEKKVTTTTNRFGALNSGSVAIIYTAANPLPPTGIDTITAQNHPTETHFLSISYSYGGSAPYTPVPPFRICDTRPVGHGVTANQCDSGPAPIGAVTQGQTRAITVGGADTVPTTGVSAVVVNLTAINPSLGTFLTLFPGGGTLPATSNLNPAAGTVSANLVEVGVNGGKINLFNAKGTVNVALDIEGYVSSSAGLMSLYNPASPVRVCDTRVGAGIATNQCNQSGANPIHAGAPLTFNVDQGSTVPTSGVDAVVFNLTAIGPSNNTFVKAYAGGTAAPNASNVNLLVGKIVPNRVIVPVTCAAGHCTVTIANSVGTVNVAVDIDGWFSVTSGPTNAKFSGVIPTRLCDTRQSTSLAPGCTHALLPAGHWLNLTVAGIGPLPALGGAGSPVAVVLNVTAVGDTSASFITVYPGPSGNPRPNASDLNIASPLAVTNLVIVKVGADGTINLYNAVGNVNLIVDVLGYYS